MPSSTVEDYLKQLYLELQRSNGHLVATGKLAASLGVTHGTATVMVKTLADSGLVDYEPRQGAKLTGEGQMLALHVLRRHRLIELFLVKVLGLDWSEVHEEAEVLEHAISEKVLAKIDTLLDYPKVDPHGDLIPGANGEFTRRRLLCLSDCEPSQTVQIARIEDQDPQFLRFADEKGLTPGIRLVIEARDPMADSVTIIPSDAAPMIIGTAAAKRIFVSPVEVSSRPSIRETIND